MNRKYLLEHLKKVRSEEIVSLTLSLYRALLKRKSGGQRLVSSPQIEKELASREVRKFLSELKGSLRLEQERIGAMPIEINPNEDTEKQLFKLGVQFVKAAEGDMPDPNTFMDEYIAAGLDVNFQEPKRKATALHLLAYHGDEEYAEKIMNTGKVNYLLADVFHRLSFDMALIDHREPENYNLRQVLLQKVEEQILREGYADWAEWSRTEGTPRYEARKKFIAKFESLG